MFTAKNECASYETIKNNLFFIDLRGCYNNLSVTVLRMHIIITFDDSSSSTLRDLGYYGDKQRDKETVA